MLNDELRGWIEQQLRGELSELPGMNALTATFQLSLQRLQSLRMTDQMQEEPTTGSLLGAFASFAPVCAAAFEEYLSCFWQHFPKHGTGTPTEVSTGADFAIIINQEVGKSRLAVFQAKRPTSSDPDKFKIHHLRKRPASKSVDGEAQIPQFLRLLYHAISIAQKEERNESHVITLESIHWVHYLIYGQKLRCLSLDKLASVKSCYDKQMPDQPWPTPKPVSIEESESRYLFWLLTNGATPSCSGDELKGWLEIDRSKVDEIRESLTAFTNVYIGHHGPGPKHTNNPEGAPISPTKILEQVHRTHDVPKRYTDLLTTSPSNQPTPRPKM